MMKKTGALLKRILTNIRRTFLKIINIRYWLDWERVKAATLYFKNSITRLFIPHREKKPESFKGAVSHFKLTEDELNIKQRALLRLSFILLGMAVFLFLYAFYQLLYGSLPAFLITMVLFGIALALAFRYHFWYFQIKNRTLGLSFQEWYKAIRGGRK